MNLIFHKTSQKFPLGDRLLEFQKLLCSIELGKLITIISHLSRIIFPILLVIAFITLCHSFEAEKRSRTEGK
jgi:hypothetical protein